MYSTIELSVIGFQLSENKIIKMLEGMPGIEGLSPHDAYRTLITNLLKNGASVSDMQFIARHANP